MKILLLRLNRKADEIIPPLGLGYLASVVKEKHKVEIIDCLKENISDVLILEKIAASDYDLIGMTFFSMDYEHIKQFAEKLKKSKPKSKFVVGGPHPSAMPKELLEEIAEIDYAFVGEAEIGFRQLVDSLENNNPDLSGVASLAWRKNGSIILNEKKCLYNLEALPLPAWDLLTPEEYPEAPHGNFYKQFPIAPIMITRGCPYLCTFCGGHSVTGRQIRYRPLDSVKEEILMLKKRGIKEIHIEDDNFTMDRRFVEDFCNWLIQENIGITWTCPNGVRLDSLDREILLLMKKAGLHTLSVGIESGSDRILRMIKKNLDTGKIREKVELIDSVGIDVVGFLIYGFPEETREEMQQTIDFACSLPLKRIAFSHLQLYPGSELFRQIRDEIGKNTIFREAYISEGFTEEELKQIRSRGLMQFYLRPKIILSIIGKMKNPRQFLFAVRRGIRWIFLNYSFDLNRNEKIVQ